MKATSATRSATTTSVRQGVEPAWLKLEPLRTLLMEKPSTPGRQPHVAAASGLVKAFGKVWVVPDDENSIAAFEGARKGEWVTVLPGSLPADKEQRRELKSDFESVAVMPAFPSAPHGGLLTLGSGSASNRTRGAFVPVGPDGDAATARPFDMRGLLERASREVAHLNIESAVVVGDRLRLMNRGGPHRDNALLDVDLAGVIGAIARDEPMTAEMFVRATPVELGELGGVPLGFTDGSPLPDGSIVFAAAAEDTDDPRLDGPVTGSVIGVLSPDGQVRCTFPVRDVKIEGIHAEVKGDDVLVTLVVDADDPSVPSPMFAAVLPGMAPKPAAAAVAGSGFDAAATREAASGAEQSSAAAFSETVKASRDAGWSASSDSDGDAKPKP